METEGEFVFATSLDTKDIEQIAEFLEQSVKGEYNNFSLPGFEVCCTCTDHVPISQTLRFA